MILGSVFVSVLQSQNQLHRLPATCEERERTSDKTHIALWRPQLIMAPTQQGQRSWLTLAHPGPVRAAEPLAEIVD